MRQTISFRGEQQKHECQTHSKRWMIITLGVWISCFGISDALASSGSNILECTG
jgi:hypothetical protein